MKQSKEVKRFFEHYREEARAIILYDKLAASERNPDLKTIYKKLSDNERKHAALWADRIKDAGFTPPSVRPTGKERLFGWAAGLFGSSSVAGSIGLIEKEAASGYDGFEPAESAGLPADERSHARVFGYLSRSSKGTGLAGAAVARFEGRHKQGSGNALRAGILGANDGLLSVFSLVMGVAGAGVAQREILITGGAGLLAGALSMALGEWISVQSSRELYQHQIDIEKEELETVPEEEKEELALIYQAKGLDAKAARELADRLISDKTTALDTLTREELAIDPEELGGSAWVASGMSFVLFAIGAILPVAPFIFLTGNAGIALSAALSALGLFVLGAASSVMTGKSLVFCGLRQVFFGLAAAAVTFGIGSLVGGRLG